jgi:DNA-binding PadR family transcriptional regulator
MRSRINWALLGLIVERPSYAYDLAQRFERRYGTALELSNIGHVYTALGALEQRSLVEEIPGTREGRQPKPRYRATEAGKDAYREWLMAEAAEDGRRRQLFVLALGALASDPRQLGEVLDSYEQTWLAQGMGTHIARDEDTPPDGLTALLGRMVEEENRLAVGAKLAWVEFARQQIGKATRETKRT